MSEQKSVVVTIKVTGSEDLVKELTRDLEEFREAYLCHGETMDISVVPRAVYDVAAEAGVDTETALKKLKVLSQMLHPEAEPLDSVEKDTVDTTKEG